MKSQRGFTLQDLALVMAVLALLAGISMPFYGDYTERARLAAVLVQYDAIREQANIVSNDSGRNLCKWKVQWAGLTPDRDTLAMKEMVDTQLAELEPAHWARDANQFLNAGNDAGPLLVQFGGSGVEGARRARLLQQEFEKIGKVYSSWGPARDSFLLHTFAVMVGDCSDVPGGHVIAASTTSSIVRTSPNCAATEQPSADGSRCEPKVCNAGQVMDAATGQCASPPAVQTASQEPQGDQKTRTCRVCGDNGPDTCEFLHEEVQCTYPNNYCMNTVNNLADGTKTVNRQCSTFADMYRNWYMASSDVEDCQTYYPDRVVNREFQCSFGCTEDNCNFDLKPPKETLWLDR